MRAQADGGTLLTQWREAQGGQEDPHHARYGFTSAAELPVEATGDMPAPDLVLGVPRSADLAFDHWEAVQGLGVTQEEVVVQTRSADGEDTEVVLVDRAAGEVVQCLRLPGSRPFAFASGFPEVAQTFGDGLLGDGDVVVVHGEEELTLSRVDPRAGEVVWDTEVPDGEPGLHHTAGVLDEELVVLSPYGLGVPDTPSGDWAMLFDHATGEPTDFAAGPDVRLHAYDAAEGEVRWSYPETGHAALVDVMPGALGGEGGVLVARLEPGQEDPEEPSAGFHVEVTLVMLDREGEVAWEAPAPPTTYRYESKVLTWEDVVVLHEDGGALSGLDAATGEELWSCEPGCVGLHAMRGLENAYPLSEGLYLWTVWDEPDLLLDPRTGELTELPQGQTAEHASPVWSIRELGPGHELLTWGEGYVVLARDPEE